MGAALSFKKDPFLVDRWVVVALLEVSFGCCVAAWSTVALLGTAFDCASCERCLLVERALPLLLVA